VVWYKLVRLATCYTATTNPLVYSYCCHLRGCNNADMPRTHMLSCCCHRCRSCNRCSTWHWCSIRCIFAYCFKHFAGAVRTDCQRGCHNARSNTSNPLLLLLLSAASAAACSAWRSACSCRAHQQGPGASEAALRLLSLLPVALAAAPCSNATSSKESSKLNVHFKFCLVHSGTPLTGNHLNSVCSRGVNDRRQVTAALHVL
jgi:hypothetical protein